MSRTAPSAPSAPSITSFAFSADALEASRLCGRMHTSLLLIEALLLGVRLLWQPRQNAMRRR
ncbi:hypothetical protein I5R65_11650 [Herbaspirillum sp. AP02]|uniref:hypothetical protein n=1 Tax=unclassified Herbaspirillum TaxID=2624150 RepID=UPI0015DA5212|nr:MULTISPECIES: hypothetical protein [unclassified Herbaspirillum]MBG7620119.1 hypothetical protein [Herbaspirillum sp. AP02]NZD69371.1 hypothetical protein [Herbaspirillum sp. AP21]